MVFREFIKLPEKQQWRMLMPSLSVGQQPTIG